MMNNEINEVIVLKDAVREAEVVAVCELNDLQLSLIGGGIADVIAG